MGIWGRGDGGRMAEGIRWNVKGRVRTGKVG